MMFGWIVFHEIAFRRDRARPYPFAAIPDNRKGRPYVNLPSNVDRNTTCRSRDARTSASSTLLSTCRATDSRLCVKRQCTLQTTCKPA
jgi:hypothetical protein